MAACRLNGYWCLYSRGKFDPPTGTKTLMAIGRQFCAVAALACALVGVHSSSARSTGGFSQSDGAPHCAVRARRRCRHRGATGGAEAHRTVGAAGHRREQSRRRRQRRQRVRHASAGGRLHRADRRRRQSRHRAISQSEARLRSGARFCRRHRARLLAADLSGHSIVAVPHDARSWSTTPRPIRCCSAVPAPVRRCT